MSLESISRSLKFKDVTLARLIWPYPSQLFSPPEIRPKSFSYSFVEPPCSDIIFLKLSFHLAVLKRSISRLDLPPLAKSFLFPVPMVLALNEAIFFLGTVHQMKQVPLVNFSLDYVHTVI